MNIQISCNPNNTLRISFPVEKDSELHKGEWLNIDFNIDEAVRFVENFQEILRHAKRLKADKDKAKSSSFSPAKPEKD